MTDKERHAFFAEHQAEIELAIDKRKYRWTLATVPWEEARQIVFIRVFSQIHNYDQSRPFPNWLSRVITNGFKNIVRDRYSRWQRPCLKCAFNTGNNTCSKTSDGLQNAECKAYKTWMKRKESEFNVKQTLAIDFHTQEVHDKPDQSADMEKGEAELNRHLKKRLSAQDYEIYILLYVDHMTEEEVGAHMGYKVKKGPMYPGYSQILEAKHRIEKMAYLIAREEELFIHG